MRVDRHGRHAELRHLDGRGRIREVPRAHLAVRARLARRELGHGEEHAVVVGEDRRPPLVRGVEPREHRARRLRHVGEPRHDRRLGDGARNQEQRERYGDPTASETCPTSSHRRPFRSLGVLVSPIVGESHGSFSGLLYLESEKCVASRHATRGSQRARSLACTVTAPAAGSFALAEQSAVHRYGNKSSRCFR